MAWKNLAPGLTRQRLIIELTTEEIVSPERQGAYLTELAELTKMEVVSGPHTGDAHECGYCAWIHWKTSGCHTYSYYGTGEQKPLLTIDCYTCKAFDPEEAVAFTRAFFEPIDLVWKEVEV